MGIVILDGNLKEVAAYESLVNPRRKAYRGSLGHSLLVQAELDEAPTFAQLWPAIAELISDKFLVFDRASYCDKKGRENNRTLGKDYSDEDIKQFVINIDRVLLTRGIKGTYVYVVDEVLRQPLRQLFPA